MSDFIPLVNKLGPITGWGHGDLVRVREGSTVTPIGQVYLQSRPEDELKLYHLERVQEGHEIWLIGGRHGIYCGTHKALEKVGSRYHRWSGWPGAICQDCLQEDQNEWCIQDHNIGLQCVYGHDMCTEHQPNVCKIHVNGPCFGPFAVKELP